jgi:glycosyltransferase involved in cell wall biosynthesis
MDQKPNVSIVVPVYNMTNSVEFLQRNLDSILKQTYTDYEIVISDNSSDDMLHIAIMLYPFPDMSKIKYFQNRKKLGMANNTNYAIDQAQGNLIKILYQDDYFADENSLKEIVDNFGDYKWLVTGCTHTNGRPHLPKFNQHANTIGSPSVLAFKREVPVRFDPKFYWVLDLDFYRKMFEIYGEPKYLNSINVVIGIGEHQSTFLLSNMRKQIEEDMMK